MSDRERAHKLIDTVAASIGLGDAMKRVAHGYLARLPEHQIGDLVARVKAVLA